MSLSAFLCGCLSVNVMPKSAEARAAKIVKFLEIMHIIEWLPSRHSGYYINF